MRRWKREIVNDKSLTVLDKFIRDYNLTNEEAAKLLGINPKTLKEIKENANKPDGFFIDKFCYFSGYKESEIFEYYSENENQGLTKSLFINAECEDLQLFHNMFLKHDYGVEDVNMNLVFKLVHKPIVSLVGDTFSNKADCFAAFNIRLEYMKYSKIPVFFFHSEDCPYCLKYSEPLVVTPIGGQTFEPSLAFDDSYLQRCQPRPFSMGENYSANSVMLVVSDFQLLKNCILLVLPDITYDNDFGKLSSNTLSILTRYIPFSDIIIFFDAITRLLTVSEVPLIEYFLSNKKNNKKILFVATKTELNNQLEGKTAYLDMQKEIQKNKQNNIFYSYYKAYSYKPLISEEKSFIQDSLFYYHKGTSDVFIYKINEMCLSFVEGMKNFIEGIQDNIQSLSYATNPSQIKSTDEQYEFFLDSIDKAINNNSEKNVIERVLDETREESFYKKFCLDVFITFTQKYSSIILSEVQQSTIFMSEFDDNLSGEMLAESILPEFNVYFANLILPVIRQKSNLSKGTIDTWTKIIYKEIKNIIDSKQKDIFLSLIKQKLIFSSRGIL